MNCPKCYGKIDKVSNRCKSCGFNMRELNGATHKDVKRAKREGFGDDVLYTTTLPADVSKKKLLLLCIFLGLFGGHSYYAGKWIKGLFSTIVTVGTIVFSALHIAFVDIQNLMGIAGAYLFSGFDLLMGVNLIMFLIDLVSIIRNKYKVSVYKDEFSKWVYAHFFN